jgi:hypothetical protein
VKGESGGAAGREGGREAERERDGERERERSRVWSETVCVLRVCSVRRGVHYAYAAGRVCCVVGASVHFIQQPTKHSVVVVVVVVNVVVVR